MTVVLWTIHILVCIFLILVILLQAGKGADMGAIFGGGGSNTVFGASGGQTFMSKMTTALAISFMVLCLILAVVSSHQSSVVTGSDVPAPVDQGAAAPGDEEQGDATGADVEGTAPAADDAAAEPEAATDQPAAEAPAEAAPSDSGEPAEPAGNNE